MGDTATVKRSRRLAERQDASVLSNRIMGGPLLCDHVLSPSARAWLTAMIVNGAVPWRWPNQFYEPACSMREEASYFFSITQ